MELHPPAITVVGSLNVDSTWRVPRIPAPGETLTARGLMTCFGGKGANQALAAARAGAKVRFIGCAGQDDPGARYLEHLQTEGIDTRGIHRVAAPTGSAFIAVDDAGENSIIVNPGANHALTPALVQSQAASIQEAGALLLQLECPLPAVLCAAHIARDAGVKILLNPSPWMPEVLGQFLPCDVLLVNETEADALGTVDPAALGCETLLITCGPRPTRVICRSGERFSLPPPRVTPVDTVGAGDTFAGSFATALTGGASLPGAVAFANAAAALSTLQPGAQTSLPRREAILAFLAASASSS